MTAILSAFLSGFALSASLIMAIGAQNAFVLRQGLKREHVGPVVLFCAAGDAALICAGVAGVGWKGAGIDSATCLAFIPAAFSCSSEGFTTGSPSVASMLLRAAFQAEERVVPSLASGTDSQKIR